MVGLATVFLGVLALASPLSEAQSIQYASVAGPSAEALCESMASSVKSSTGLTINNTFSQYFPEGSMPSLERLASMYPNGTIPAGINVKSILDSVGPDIDIKSDAGYGRANGRAAQNGPTGSLPAFCRYGAFIQTSSLTITLAEVWLPLASDPSIPLIDPNTTDYPTNTTPYNIGPDGSFLTSPLYYQKGQYEKIQPAPGSCNPPAPNDVPCSSSDNMTAKAPTRRDVTVFEPFSSLYKRSNGFTYKPKKRSAAKDSFDEFVKRGEVAAALTGEQVLGDQDGWNGRLVLMGNGGQRGFVPLRDMKQLISRYQFAVAGTNLGHFSGATGVTWVNGSQFDDTLLDWASRANHVTLQLAEDVVDAFYGPTAGVRVPSDNRVRRYYFGSSVGGARGLSAAQVNPLDFHGILAGAPATDFMDMNVGQLHIASIHNKSFIGDGWFTQNALYGPIKDVVTSQCDALDGVIDGIISDPFNCSPDLARDLLCGTQTKYGSSNGTCLTDAQIKAAMMLYDPTVIDGQQVYPPYLPGLEDSASNMEAANAKASGWYQLVVLKQDKLNKSFNPFTDIHYNDLQKGNAADPGSANAVQTDLSEFVKAGGKMLMYHGTYDLVISSVATINYFEKAMSDTMAKTGDACLDSFKFYLVPGMRHSRAGPGAWHFGGITQYSPGNRPYKYDTQYDMILALVAWAETGAEPNAQIAARYVQREALQPARATNSSSEPTDLPLPDSQQNYNWGLVNTRLLCPWPKQAKYNGRDNPDGTEGYKAFYCA